ncbi:carbohydrate ABC transporter membrane protein 2, CUT1 family [Actinacidiphila yanglinensis]|uniref:Carbohydrate ABC transporter membrane protein 2, CUT1 family n=1 Tax=Actinacidiphila yanglinensis TaxID=310779 RepID=A0A1H6B4V6_9ACTN|nr:carbohydrate ABC transporter permease [Actinacidiphila yanglinensis]SEG55881.1 carbohydrate ABC transporter membrane protein 2, CUT1 family [Actinacidiphila yanglinensis]
MAVTDSPRMAAARPAASRDRTGRSRRSRVRASRGTINVVLLLFSVLYLVPLLWMVLASFNAHASFKLNVPSPTTANFHHVLTYDTTFRPMLNGLLLCGGGTLVCVVCSILAAYPLSRFRSRLRRPFLYTILFTTGLPITAVMIPVYSMFVQVNLIDSMPATTLFLAASALPFGIWLMKNFMDGVPVVLEEAARIDGANSMQVLWRIVLPLMWPGVIVVTIFTFISMWGNFFVPFILLLSPEKLPASVSVFNFLSAHDQTQYGQLSAFSILYSIPVVMLYLILARRLGGGFALGGALKG